MVAGTGKTSSNNFMMGRQRQGDPTATYISISSPFTGTGHHTRLAMRLVD